MVTAKIKNVLVKGLEKELVIVAFSKYEFGFGKSDKLSPEQVLRIAPKVYPFPTINSKSKVENIHDSDLNKHKQQ